MLNELIDPNTPKHVDEIEQDELVIHTDLLMQGKLIKHLRKSRYSDEDSYQIFSEVAQEVAAIENASATNGELHTATWKKAYQQESSAGKALLAFILPMGFLLTAGDSKRFTFDTQHYITGNLGKYFWLRRLLTLIGQLIGGVGIAFSLISLVLLIAFLSDPYESFDSVSGWLSWTITALIASIILYRKSRKHAIPPQLRMYAGKTFELVKLKRVK